MSFRTRSSMERTTTLSTISNYLTAQRRIGVEIRYRDDCERIQRVCAAHGVNLPIVVCQHAWEARSDAWAASWLILPDDDGEIWSDIGPYVTDPDMQTSHE